MSENGHPEREREALDDRDVETERWLRSAKPRPDPQFVETLGRRLFAPGTERRRGRLGSPAWRPAAAGLLAAGSMTAALLVLSLAGVGPLAPSDDGRSAAQDDCRYVTVTKEKRIPRIVTGPDGQPQIRTTTREVRTRVKRCR